MKEKQQIEKIKEIIEDSKVGMMGTNLGNMPFSVFPMGTQQVDENGDLWFFSSRNSDHFEDIQENSRVHFTYSNEGKQEYLSIIVDAVPIVNIKKFDELWNPMLNNWFEGKNDPNLVLLNVRIEQAKYWDSESNQMMSLINFPKSQFEEIETEQVDSL